jgi:serine/threonine-protein kinase
VYELGVIDGVYFLAMERVEGATIAELLADGPLDEAMCAHVGAQLCEALRYAHERFGLVHRDVTPRNVIIDAGGHVRLLDFGIAAPLAHSTPGELFGSPGHMSPEQARGEALGPQSDLFSLGTVLYEALTCERALARDATGAQTDERAKTLGAHASRDVELAALIDQLLEPSAAARPASAAEAAARFRTWLAQRHPEGVAAELGRRAEQARGRGTRPSTRPPAGLEPEGSATPRLTRSIATSPELTEMLGAGTEPLARPARPAASDAPAKRAWPRLVLVAMIALVGVALLAQRQPAPRLRASSNASSRAQAARTDTAPAPAEPRRAAPEPGSKSSGTKTTTNTTTTTATATATGVGVAADAARPAEPAPAANRAALSVNALPWAELKLDGRPAGTTPQRALPVSPGSHVLLLDCPPLGRKARVALKLDPGAHRRILVDLNTDPPRVTVE